MQRRPVNARQLNVLRWVDDGSPSRNWPDESYKTTARALENRGLVTVSKLGGTWTASITDVGRHYLEHGDYPAVEGSAATAPDGSGKPKIRGIPKSKVGPKPRRVPIPTPDADIRHAERVIELVIGGEGWVDLGRVDFDTQRVLAVVSRASNKPFDKILRFSAYGGWADRKHVAYFDDDLTLTVERHDIAVPDRVTKPHPAAAAYKADPDQHMVSKDSLSRAVRILHALLTEATKRGHTVTPRRFKNVDYSAFRTAIGNGQVDITVDESTYGILITEKPGKGSERQVYGYYPHNKPRKKQPMWREVRQNTFVPTGQLSVTIVTPGSNRDGRPLVFNDGARKVLEERLGEVLWEIEVRALEDARAARRAEAAALEKQRLWEKAIELAKRRLVASHRREVLDRQVAAWSQANLRRDYVDAMAATVEAMPEGENRYQAQAWLEWCTNSIGPDDPLQRRLKVPKSPEPTAQNLEPFLDGWSPPGPDGYGRR